MDQLDYDMFSLMRMSFNKGVLAAEMLISSNDRMVSIELPIVRGSEVKQVDKHRASLRTTDTRAKLSFLAW